MDQTPLRPPPGRYEPVPDERRRRAGRAALWVLGALGVAGALWIGIGAARTPVTWSDIGFTIDGPDQVEVVFEVARIQQLQEILRKAVVGAAPPDDGVVEPGMVVTATVAGDRMTFLIGSREVAEGTDIEVYSERSPLGAAIIGCSAGDETSYEAPNGRTIPVVIHEAKPFQP